MTINNEPKVAMDKVAMEAAKSLLDPVASQGARRATGDATGSAASAKPAKPSSVDTEVVPRARRRHLSNANKRRILEAIDRCTKPGEVGALMRRENVYSSSLSTWRRQLAAADLAALAPQKRGPKAYPNRAEALRIVQLTRDVGRLTAQLDKALLVIEVQKKLSALLGHTLDENDERT
jgi:transposase-like protein